MLADTAARYPDRIAQRLRVDDAWEQTSYRELHRRVRALGAALIDRGLAEGDRVALFAPNLPAWSVVDLAVISAGGLLVPIFSTCTPEQSAHIITNSGTGIVVCHSQREVDIVTRGLADKDHPVTILTIDPVEGQGTIGDLIALQADETELDRRLDASMLDDECSIIYTSGTTGLPRGAVHTHRTFTYQLDVFRQVWAFEEGDSSLAFLPLAHVLERMWT